MHGDPRRSPHADETIRWVAALNEMYRDAPGHAHRRLRSSRVRVARSATTTRPACACSCATIRPGSAPPVLVVANFTPVVREGYAIGVPIGGEWQRVFSSDDAGVRRQRRHRR